MPDRRSWIWIALAGALVALVVLAAFAVDWSKFHYVDETVAVVVIPPTE